jgi:hypothetical protein
VQPASALQLIDGHLLWQASTVEIGQRDALVRVGLGPPGVANVVTQKGDAERAV